MGTARPPGSRSSALPTPTGPVALHTPSEVKAAVTGSGRADKAQVERDGDPAAAARWPPRPADAADALALAICHAWRGLAQSDFGAPWPRTGRPARQDPAALGTECQPMIAS